MSNKTHCESYLYLCKECGNLIEIIHFGSSALKCCGQDMILLKANSTDAAQEKHVPVMVDKGGFVEVTVGSVEHPMDEKHYIPFIEILTPDKVYRHDLKPGDKPFVVFPVKFEEIYLVRAYCNLHGLWVNG